jgi:RND superfamily putative drug exporter
MVSVFAIFASLHMVEMKELGLSLAVAVLIDAIVVRGIVLPSFLALMGERVWWPGRLPRANARLAARSDSSDRSGLARVH